MKLWEHPLTENDLRQCLRIAAGATLGLTICKVLDLDNGVFFTLLPVILLVMVPVINGHAARQMIAAGVACFIEIELVYAVFSFHPVLATFVMLLLFLVCFICMSKGPFYLFGSSCLLSLSIMVHFASYPATDVNGLASSNLIANILSLGIAYLLTALIPDAEPRQPRPAPPPKQSHRTRHEALLGTTLALMSFWAFQVLDLQDSMSAQTTSILLLFPMNWNGALQYSKKRAFGAILGVSYGLGCQFLLYSWSSELYLVIPLFWIGILLFSYCHIKEAAGTGVGFGGLTTTGLLFGQDLSPDQDLTFNALYLISCIMSGIICTLVLIYLVHKLLNQHPATQFGE
jgi:hypothetical protein